MEGGIGPWRDEVNQYRRESEGAFQEEGEESRDLGFDIIDVDPEYFEIERVFLEPPLNAEPEPTPECVLLLNAVRDGDHNAASRLLAEGATFKAKEPDGKGVVHIAVRNNDAEMVKFLFEKGADGEAADEDGIRPLYFAVALGNLTMINLLLKLNVNVESTNLELGQNALYLAVERKFLAAVEALLDNGADVNARTPSGYTALFSAVIAWEHDLVLYLLKRGADTTLQAEDGQTAEELAIGNNDILHLLQSTQLQDGPSIANPKASPEVRFVHASPAPAGNIYKLNACRGFEGTIVDFFGGEHERRIQVSPTIYEMLYGKGPDAIMTEARGSKSKQFIHQRYPAV